ncbi:MAG TPA: hypothetical protein VK646_11790 [Actinomycetota bacterium]|nr:hypothetical protein [Actinomycetota bacterium]
MDDSVPGGIPSSSEPPRPSATSELRARLQLNAPAPSPEPVAAVTDELRVAKERIVTLETLLTQSRAREDALTTQGFKDQATIARFGAKNAELAAIAAGAATNEAARREAESAAAEADRSRQHAQEELEVRLVELQQLRDRCTELQTDLAALAGETAKAAIARAEADRMAAERDEARGRAETERQLAAQDRARAEAAERLAAALQGRALPDRSGGVGDRRGVAPPKRSMAPPVPKLVGATPPWIELQRGSSAAPSATVLPWPPKEKLAEKAAAGEPAPEDAPEPLETTPPAAEEIIDLSDG